MVAWCSGAGREWLSTSPHFPLWRWPSPTSERAGLLAYELMSLLTSMSKITSSTSGKVSILDHNIDPADSELSRCVLGMELFGFHVDVSLQPVLLSVQGSESMMFAF